MRERPKIAFFDFACCEGCQLQIANLGEPLLDLLELVELVEFREILSESWPGRYAIAFVEGSIIGSEAEQRLRTLRHRSDLLVAYGSCATSGGINGIINSRSPQSSRAEGNPRIRVRALHQVVPVDYFIPGCPILPAEFFRVLKSALAGLRYALPDYAVCVECKLNENVCMYDMGAVCLGPVTRAGCDAWCINSGNSCYGCRGMVSNPNQAGAEEVLKRHGLQSDQIVNRMRMYSTALEDGNE